MISVKRGAVPASLDVQNSTGAIETRAAIRANKKGESFDYKSYKNPDVVQALRAMFRNKCAYCEFPYAAGGPEDVEHFRPKAAVIVNGKLRKPGYYWLGAEWTNLLPSCIDCNRRRRKEFANSPKGLSGKANIFPVLDEKCRWRSHRAQNREAPLLLNPCDDIPGQHLEFIDGGLVRPRIDSTGTVSLKGERSIEVYGLLRSDLVQQRKAKGIRVRAAIEVALEALEMAEQEVDVQRRKRQEEFAAKLLREARTHLGEDEPYLATARSVFEEYGLSQ